MDKFAVDQVENDIVILENILTKEKRELSINNFNFKINEKDVLVFDGKSYFLDNKLKEERLNKIKEKFNRLKG